jgi:hypothetical protein
MYFDSLTVAGLAAISLYALLPLVFRGEFLWVNEGDGKGPVTDRSAEKGTGAHALANPGPCPEPCEETA